MPECQSCGSVVPEGTKYCPHCGTAQQETPIAASPTPPPPQPSFPGPPVPPSAQPAGATPPPIVSGAMSGPPVKKGLSGGAKIAIGLGVCAVVLIILAIVFVVIFFANVIGAPADVSNNYVKALNTGAVATAWTYLTEETQRQETRSGFESKVGALKGQITKYNTGSINVNSQAGSPSTAKVVMNLGLKDGSKATWDMYLVKENGEWKIQQVSPR